MRFSLKKSVFSEPNHLLVNWKTGLLFCIYKGGEIQVTGGDFLQIEVIFYWFGHNFLLASGELSKFQGQAQAKFAVRWVNINPLEKATYFFLEDAFCVSLIFVNAPAWTPLSSSFTYPPPTPIWLNELMAPCSFWKIQILEDFGDSLGIPRDSKGFLRINFVESNYGDVCEVSSPWSNIVPTCWMCFKRKVTTESQTFPSESLRGQ